MTISSITYSLLQDGSSVVVDGSTEAVSQIVKSLVMVYTIGSKTLIAGGSEITVSGTEISLGSDGQSIVISGSVTEDVSMWLRSSAASGTPGKIGSASGSQGGKPSTSTSHKSLSSSSYGRSERGLWHFWSAVMFTILRLGDVL